MPYTLAVISTALVLAFASVLIHYETLARTTRAARALAMGRRFTMIFVVFCLLLGHFAEIALYAVGFAFLLGWETGQSAFAVSDQAIYLSLESYASLGTNVGPPTGALRLLAGTEAMVGLILVGWTTAYTYFAMSELWGRR